MFLKKKISKLEVSRWFSLGDKLKVSTIIQYLFIRFLIKKKKSLKQKLKTIVYFLNKSFLTDHLSMKLRKRNCVLFYIL